jgi:hypothetical protein
LLVEEALDEAAHDARHAEPVGRGPSTEPTVELGRESNEQRLLNLSNDLHAELAMRDQGHAAAVQLLPRFRALTEAAREEVS